MKKSRAEDHRASPCSGFTLIEVVVTLAIAAIGLGALMAAASTGLGNAALADQYIDATRRAQSHLAELGTTAPFVPGVQSGDDGGGFSWRTRISTPVARGGPSADGQATAGLYTVEVTISWQRGRETRDVSLQSQRLARQ